MLLWHWGPLSEWVVSKRHEDVPNQGRSPLTALKYRRHKPSRVLERQLQRLSSEDIAVFSDFNLQDYKGACKPSLAFWDICYGTSDHALSRSSFSFLMASHCSMPQDKGSKLTLAISSNPFSHLLYTDSFTLQGLGLVSDRQTFAPKLSSFVISHSHSVLLSL